MADVYYWTVILSNSKKQPQEVFQKKVFVNVCSLKEKTCIEVYLFNKVAIQMFSNECCEISKNAYFEEHLRMAASELTLGSNYLWLFLDSRFQNHPDLVILHKYQSFLNQKIKHSLVRISSLNLTPTLSFEP